MENLPLHILLNGVSRLIEGIALGANDGGPPLRATPLQTGVAHGGGVAIDANAVGLNRFESPVQGALDFGWTESRRVPILKQADSLVSVGAARLHFEDVQLVAVRQFNHPTGGAGQFRKRLPASMMIGNHALDQADNSQRDSGLCHEFHDKACKRRSW